jgi:hypothetical protein
LHNPLPKKLKRKMGKRNKNKQSKDISMLKDPPLTPTEATTSVDTTKHGVNHSELKHPYKKRKHRSDNANDDCEAESITENETANNTQNIPTSVWVALDGDRNYIGEIEVTNGESIYSIKKKVKNEATNTFAKVDAVEIQLYRSMPLTEAEIENSETLLEKEGNALRSTERWFSGVSWGTDIQPLIVDAPNSDNGEACFVVVSLVDIAHNFAIHGIIFAL